MRNLVIACLFFGVGALHTAASAGELALGVEEGAQPQDSFVVDLALGAAARGEAVIPLDAPAGGAVSSAHWLELRASTDAAEEAPGMRSPLLGLEGALWSNLAVGATEQGAGDWRLAFEEEVQGHLFWLHVAQRASFNRRVGLSERFGRGRAGDLSLGYEVALQPFFLGQEGWSPEGFVGVSFRADYGVNPRQARAPHAGPPFAWELNVDFVEWVWQGPVRPARLELFRIGLAQAGVPTQTRCDAEGCVEDGVGVFGLQLDAVDFDGGDLDVLGFTWGAYAGFDVLAPVSAYRSTTTVGSSADAVDVEHAVESSGPASLWPHLGLRLSLHDPIACVVRRGADATRCSDESALLRASVETFHRFVAGGHATDGGVAGRLEAVVPWSDALRSRVLIERTYGVRTSQSDGGSPDGAELGDVTEMMNVEADLQWAFAPSWSVTLFTWVELSDRDDPTRLGPSNGSELRWSLGADAGVTYRY